MKTRILTTAACLFSILLNSCDDMTPVPRTQIHTSDLNSDDFGLMAGKVVSRTGLSGPYQLTEGTIDEYTNQSGKPELVWLGGTEEEPSCAWVVFPDSTAMKLKWPTPNEQGFCAQVIECLAADIARGSGTPDKYRIPQMDGPTWRVVSVEWIDEDGDSISTSFALDTGTDLTSLVASLNDSSNLPEGWYWEILTSALALCVPYQTNIVKVVLEGGEEAVFNGVPTVIGTPSSRLGSSIEVTPGIVGNGAAVGSEYDTEGVIEAQFALIQNVTVRWTDALGTERVSYKDPVNGWLHSGAGAFVGSVQDTQAEIASQFSQVPTVTVRWTDASGAKRVSYKDPFNGGWTHGYVLETDPRHVYFENPIEILAVSGVVGGPFGDQRLSAINSHVPENADYFDLRIYLRATATASSGVPLSTAGAWCALLDIENGVHSAITDLPTLLNAVHLPSGADERRTAFSASMSASSNLTGLVNCNHHASTIRLQRRSFSAPQPNCTPALRYSVTIGSLSAINTSSRIVVQLLGYGYNSP